MYLHGDTSLNRLFAKFSSYAIKVELTVNYRPRLLAYLTSIYDSIIKSQCPAEWCGKRAALPRHDVYVVLDYIVKVFNRFVGRRLPKEPQATSCLDNPVLVVFLQETSSLLIQIIINLQIIDEIIFLFIPRLYLKTFYVKL